VLTVQTNDPNLWNNTENYADVGIHNRLLPTNYGTVPPTVTWRLMLLPIVKTDAEVDTGQAGACSYAGTEIRDGETIYIFRATFQYAMLEGRTYAVDFSCPAIKFGKRIKKQAAYY
jgi:hypothetical protein